MDQIKIFHQRTHRYTGSAGVSSAVTQIQIIVLLIQGNKASALLKVTFTDEIATNASCGKVDNVVKLL